jgi:hypothetical protein
MDQYADGLGELFEKLNVRIMIGHSVGRRTRRFFEPE